MTELSAYVLEPIREGPDFTIYRGRQHGGPPFVKLAVALAAEHPSPQGLRRLEHEHSLAAELDSAWAAKPLALTRHEGRTILILMDPGGEPLDLVLQRANCSTPWKAKAGIRNHRPAASKCAAPATNSCGRSSSGSWASI
jgi:hypothetical protein